MIAVSINKALEGAGLLENDFVAACADAFVAAVTRAWTSWEDADRKFWLGVIDEAVKAAVVSYISAKLLKSLGPRLGLPDLDEDFVQRVLVPKLTRQAVGKIAMLFVKGSIKKVQELLLELLATSVSERVR